MTEVKDLAQDLAVVAHEMWVLSPFRAPTHNGWTLVFVWMEQKSEA